MKKSGAAIKKQGFSQKVFLFNKEGKFLTIRRTKTAPADPLKWDLPGGDVEFGEDPYKAIAREVAEETNLKAAAFSLFDVTSELYTSTIHWITLAYRATIKSGQLKISWEHDLHKWVTADEFLKLKISKKLRHFAKSLKNQK